MAIAGSGEGSAQQILTAHGVTKQTLLSAIQELRGSHRVTDDNPEAKFEALKNYGRDLTELARKGKFKGMHPVFLEQWVHPANVTRIGEEVMAITQRMGREAFIRQQTAILNRPDSIPTLSTISRLVTVNGAHGASATCSIAPSRAS